MKKKFKVYDIQEGVEVLGYVDTMEEVKKLTKEQVDATDGDCYVVYTEYNPIIKKYPHKNCEIASI